MNKLQYLLFTCLGIFLTLSSVAKVNTSDSLALVALYEATEGENWTDNTAWLEEDITNWKGIFLDVTQTRVIGISLINNNLNGTLPSINLSELKWLNLSSNQIGGAVPDFELPNLQNLALSNNQLEGEIPDFSAMPLLQLIALSENQLEGTVPDFSNLPELDWLNLSGNQLEGKIPDFSQNLQLKEIYLNNNQLSGTLPYLGHLTQLEAWWIQNNALTFDGLEENIEVQTNNPIFETFRYAPQNMVDLEHNIDDVLSMSAGTSTNIRYHWYRNGQWVETSTENFYIVTQAGDYYCSATNSAATNLNLQSKSIHFDHNKCTLAEPFVLPPMATSEYIGPFNNQNMGNPMTEHSLAVCFDDASLDNLLWHTFVGDGETYSFYIHGHDSTIENALENAQIAIYEGICGELNTLICNDKMSSQSEQAWAVLQTKPNQIYYLMIDGQADAAGEFYIETWKGESIWAGDTDNNGEVNHHDLLAIGLAYGFGGTARANPSTVFLPIGAEKWTNEFNNDLNYHFADANGDGAIHATDALAIRENYKQNHANYTHSATGLSPIDSDNGLPLQLTATLTDTIQTGYEYLFQIGTEENHPAFEEILGVSMTLEISVAANVPDTVTIQAPVIFYDNSVMGSQNVNLLTLDSLQLLEHNHYEWDIALVKNDHKGVSEGGELCSIACIFSVGSIGKNGAKKMSLTIRLKDLKVVNKNEKTIAIQSLPFQRFTIGENEDGLPTAMENHALPTLQFYPNPSRDWLQVSPPIEFSNDLTVKLFDRNGALVLMQDELEVDVRFLQRGLYWLVLEDKLSGKRTKMEKVVVM